MNVRTGSPPNSPAAITNATQHSDDLWRVLLKPLAISLPILASFFFVMYIAIQLTLRRHITAIPKLEIDSLTASNFNISSRPNQIYADWNVQMNLETKNNHGYLRFLDITVSIYYNVLQAGVTNVIPFDVAPLNSTKHFQVKFSGSSGFFDDSMINDINGSIAAADTLTIDVMFEASLRKSFKGRWTDHLQLKMDCKEIKLSFGDSDKSRAQMLNPPHKCQVVGDDRARYLA